jgi:hypothetical protein
VAVYQRAGVEEYFVLDSGQRNVGDDPCYRVLGYRLAGGVFAAVAPDDAGRVFSEVNGVWIGPNEPGDGFVVIDGRTGQPICLADTAPQPPSAAESEAQRRASAIADQLSGFLKGSGLE